MHAVSATGALIACSTCNNTFEVTQMRNHMHAVSAASALVREATCKDILKLTHMRNHIIIIIMCAFITPHMSIKCG